MMLSSSLKRSSLVLLLLLAFCSGRVDHVEAANPASLSVEQLLNGLVDYYSRIEKLPALEVEYRIENEFHHKSSVIGDWKWQEFTHVVRPGDKKKLYVRYRYPAPSSRDSQKKEVIRDKVYSRDDDLVVRVETSDEGGKTYPAAAALMTPSQEGPSPIPPFLFPYFNYLAFPVSEQPEAGLPPRMLYPKDSFWLPDAPRKNRSAYTVVKELEEIGGIWCHVLDRPGLDRLWVQTEPAFVLRRRQVWWGDGKPIRENCLFDDFVQVTPQLSLPRTIIREVYGAPWDDTGLQNKVCSRLHLRVSKLVVEPVPDNRFRADIPDGSLVDDLISSGSPKKPISFIHRPGADPFARALETLKRNQTPGWRRWYFIVAAGAGILIVLSLFYRRWRKRSTAGS